MGSPTAPVAANPLLDLADHVGIVRSAIRFDVLNRELDVIGEVQPVASGGVATIVNQSTARNPRTLRGFTLPGEQANDLNVYSDRIRPVWLLEDGSGVAGLGGWPLGVFLPQNPDRQIATWDSPLTASLVDLTYLLDQENPRRFQATNRAVVTDKIEELVRAAGFVDYVVEPSDVRVLDSIAKVPGTSFGETIRDLCQLVAYLPPWVDNEGVLRVEPPPPLVDGTHVIRYPLEADRSRCIRDTILVSPQTDLPGAYRVINSGATKGPVWAIAYVDPDLPWSRERRGFLITKTVRMQGIESTAQAMRIARSMIDAQPGAGAVFDGPPDPRHDTNNVVEFGEPGTLWRETAWSLRLSPSGPMSHTLVRGSGV